MRKITKLAVHAFLMGKDFNLSNTSVETVIGGTVMYLFDNAIAFRNSKNGTISITNAGWKSNTTKERLNGLPNVSINQSKGVWYLNGVQWDGNLEIVPQG